MKKIGLTDPRGDSPPAVLVEMSQGEYDTFRLLETACTDILPDDFGYTPELRGGVDLGAPFYAVRHWVIQKFKITEMRVMLDRLEDKLNDD